MNQSFFYIGAAKNTVIARQKTIFHYSPVQAKAEVLGPPLSITQGNQAFRAAVLSGLVGFVNPRKG
ncbi:hypothetical protein EJB05_13188, partial [Eragrostis curvula]